MRRARWPGRAARSRVTATESARRAMTRWRMTVSRVLAANSVARRAWLDCRAAAETSPALHGPGSDLRGDLGRAEGGVDAFAREGIEEAGGISGQKHAVHAGWGNPVTERAQRADGPRAPRVPEPLAESRELSRDAIEVTGEVRLVPPRLLDRDHEAQIADAGADRVQDRVRGWGEDDLASLGIARRALDVGHQREPVKPRMWALEAPGAPRSRRSARRRRPRAAPRIAPPPRSAARVRRARRRRR